jgi:hypothetical protein
MRREFGSDGVATAFVEQIRDDDTACLVERLPDTILIRSASEYWNLHAQPLHRDGLS